MGGSLMIQDELLLEVIGLRTYFHLDQGITRV